MTVSLDAILRAPSVGRRSTSSDSSPNSPNSSSNALIYVPPFADLGLRFVSGIGPRSMMPFSANSRRTGHRRLRALGEPLLDFVLVDFDRRGSVRGL